MRTLSSIKLKLGEKYSTIKHPDILLDSLLKKHAKIKYTEDLLGVGTTPPDYKTTKFKGTAMNWLDPINIIIKNEVVPTSDIEDYVSPFEKSSWTQTKPVAIDQTNGEVYTLTAYREGEIQASYSYTNVALIISDILQDSVVNDSYSSYQRGSIGVVKRDPLQTAMQLKESVKRDSDSIEVTELSRVSCGKHYGGRNVTREERIKDSGNVWYPYS